MDYTYIKGLNISKLTLGTVQLGMEYGIANENGKPDLEKSFSILQASLDQGINSFDTARAYGNSEEVLGKFFTLKESKPEVVFTTKFKIMPETGVTSSNIERQVSSFAEQSLQRLNIKKLPIYMLHDAKDMIQYGDIIPKTLKRLKEKGLISLAGVSVYNPEEAEEMLKWDIYEAVQMPINIFDQRMINSGTLKRLKDKGIIVFVRSVFLQGLFFLDPIKLPERLKKAKEPLLELQNLSRRENISIAKLAISFIQNLEGVTSLVLGAETPEQILESAKIINTPATDSEIEGEIFDKFKSVPILDIMAGLK